MDVVGHAIPIMEGVPLEDPLAGMVLESRASVPLPSGRSKIFDDLRLSQNKVQKVGREGVSRVG